MADDKKEKKSKKVNQLSIEEITKKIQELEEGNGASKKYYQHLVQRKKEIGA